MVVSLVLIAWRADCRYFTTVALVNSICVKGRRTTSVEHCSRDVRVVKGGEEGGGIAWPLNNGTLLPLPSIFFLSCYSSSKPKW